MGKLLRVAKMPHSVARNHSFGPKSFRRLGILAIAQRRTSLVLQYQSKVFTPLSTVFYRFFTGAFGS